MSFNKGNGSLGLLASTLLLSSLFCSRTSLFLQKAVILLKPDLRTVTEHWHLFGQRDFQRDGHCYLNIYINCQFHYTRIDLGKNNHLDSNDSWRLTCNFYAPGCCVLCTALPLDMYGNASISLVSQLAGPAPKYCCHQTPLPAFL